MVGLRGRAGLLFCPRRYLIFRRHIQTASMSWSAWTSRRCVTGITPIGVTSPEAYYCAHYRDNPRLDRCSTGGRVGSRSGCELVALPQHQGAYCCEPRKFRRIRPNADGRLEYVKHGIPMNLSMPQAAKRDCGFTSSGFTRPVFRFCLIILSQ